MENADSKPKPWFKRLSLTTWIFIALILGVLAGLALQGAPEIADTYIKPFGTIFLNLIKMIVVPLVLFSIIAGVVSLDDVKKVGAIGGKTVLFYLATTACAVTLGLRKTSVEQLTEAAGISKGLFYKYFASKELLFFEVLEDIHSEVYQVAEQALEEGKDLPPDERIANVLLTACSRLSELGAMKFIEEDSAYLLRRIPAQVKAEHYHSDEVHIRDLLEESGLTPRGGIALAAATIRGLILTVSHQEQIGALYPQVLETLTRGACEELFPRA